MEIALSHIINALAWFDGLPMSTKATIWPPYAIESWKESLLPSLLDWLASQKEMATSYLTDLILKAYTDNLSFTKIIPLNSPR